MEPLRTLKEYHSRNTETSPEFGTFLNARKFGQVQIGDGVFVEAH